MAHSASFAQHGACRHGQFVITDLLFGQSTFVHVKIERKTSIVEIEKPASKHFFELYFSQRENRPDRHASLAALRA